MSQTESKRAAPHRRQRKRSRYPYTRKEKWIVGWACAQLSLALWILALTPLWAQWLMMGMSFIGLTFSLLPQFYAPESQRDPRLHSRPSLDRLLRYPVFWLGALLLSYMLVQAVNPAYGYESDADYWRAFPIPSISWLPSGVDSPFAKMNAQRLALIVASAWAMQCYLKVGIVRRPSFLFLLWWITLNFVAMGVLAIAQKQTDAMDVYWSLSISPNFWGPIPYNHRAGCLLIMGMVCAMALYFLHLKAMRMELRHSGPHLVVLIAIVFIFGLLWSTQSEATVILGSLLMAVFLLLTLIPSLRDGSTLMHKVILSVTMILLGVMAVFYTLRLPDRNLTIEQLGNLREEIQNIDSSARAIATRITLQMVAERPFLGWGAGSWRYVFAYYQLEHPEIQYLDATQTVPAVWDDAHNDWVQYLSELGIVGMVLLLGLLLWPLIESIIFIRSLHLTQVMLALGLIAVFTHAFLELLLQNQAVLSYVAFLSFLINRLNVEQVRVKH